MLDWNFFWRVVSIWEIKRCAEAILGEAAGGIAPPCSTTSWFGMA